MPLSHNTFPYSHQRKLQWKANTSDNETSNVMNKKLNKKNKIKMKNQLDVIKKQKMKTKKARNKIQKTVIAEVLGDNTEHKLNKKNKKKRKLPQDFLEGSENGVIDTISSKNGNVFEMGVEDTNGKMSLKKKSKKKHTFVEEPKDGKISLKKKSKKKRTFVEEPIENLEDNKNIEISNKKIKLMENSEAFNETVSKHKKPKDKKDDSKKRPSEISAERNARTVFVGNLPHSITSEKVTKLFSKYGSVEKVWVRGAIGVEEGGSSKKVTIMKKLFQKNHPPLIAFVVFSIKEEAENALQMNGQIYKDHHLRVNFSDSSLCRQSDKEKSVFLGHLKTNVQEEEIWNMFKDCGEIDSVRLVRDPVTGNCKGFGFINFKSSDAVELALQLNDQPMNEKGHTIRVQRNTKTDTAKHKIALRKQQKKKRNSDNIASEKEVTKKNKFRGQSADFVRKKKAKTNKLEFKKKTLAKKLTAKTKKGHNS